MTNTKEMLEAAPVGVPLSTADLATAIDACLACFQTCTSCADADLAEPDIDAMRTCIALCLSCAEMCEVTARFLSRPAHWEPAIVHRLLQACVRSCADSAAECAKHAPHHRHCAICEKACRECVAACEVLLDHEMFQALRDS